MRKHQAVSIQRAPPFAISHQKRTYTLVYFTQLPPENVYNKKIRQLSQEHKFIVSRYVSSYVA